MSRLNIFIISSVFIVLAISVLLAGTLFYAKSTEVMTEIYKERIVHNLELINRNVAEQVAVIDSIYTHLISNTLIRDNLDPAAESYSENNDSERRLEIEKQMSYMLVSSILWSENLLSGVYIFSSDGSCARFSTSSDTGLSSAVEVARQCDPKVPTLQIRLSGNGTIHFVRNIFSMNTGNKIATIVIDLKEREWAEHISAGMDENWLILLKNEDILLSLGVSPVENERIDALLSIVDSYDGFQEAVVLDMEHFVASQKLSTAGLISVVSVAKEYLLRDLREAQSSFLLTYSFIVLVSMLLIFLAIMLFRGLYEQNILLKNAEIKALQAQIDPHFLFNVMNTIAWKAEIGGNSEVYDMVLSLCEMLQANALSKDKAFVTLKEELNYVQLYLYLQQKRFDGKFEVEIDCNDVSEMVQVPRFCIQPLVENVILHGFEPLPDNGSDWLLTIRVKPEGSGIRVWVEDNGAGFPDDFSIEKLKPAKDGEHSHIALCNLNQRLLWIGGAHNNLSISKENDKTSVSFWLPGKEIKRCTKY
ncbi:MAG: histidine kinase [Oscillospiraceae bacterium]|nr:histidine kinase [Oscillospiraceae bacterium]